jgi:hypothetical protein
MQYGVAYIDRKGEKHFKACYVPRNLESARKLVKGLNATAQAKALRPAKYVVMELGAIHATQ